MEACINHVCDLREYDELPFIRFLTHQTGIDTEIKTNFVFRLIFDTRCARCALIGVIGVIGGLIFDTRCALRLVQGLLQSPCFPSLNPLTNR